MKKTLLLFLVVFITMSLPALALAGYEDYYVPFEDNATNGMYKVSVLSGGQWKEAGSLGYGKYFLQKGIDLSGFITVGKPLQVRIEQAGGGAAHIDAVRLGKQAPVHVNGDSDGKALAKLSKRDFDVMEASKKSIELSFLVKEGNLGKSHGSFLSITARVEAEVISTAPFQFPRRNMLVKMDASSQFLTYALGSKSEKPFFREMSYAGSGHPSGYTYGWVSNDRDNLYVKMDFTSDNTMDGGKDYAKVYVNTKDGLSEFKVSTKKTTWGKPSFTYTDKVPYQHKVYDFAIPLKQLGVSDASKATDIQLAFAAYGTSSPGEIMGTVLSDSEGFLYTIDHYGGQTYYAWDPSATFDAIDTYGQIKINIGSNQEYYNDWTYDFSLEQGGREVGLTNQTMFNLEVKKKIYVPSDGNFMRHMTFIENPTVGDIMLTYMEIDASPDYSARVVEDTSDGDTTVEVTDSWYVMSENGNAAYEPAVAYVWNGTGSSLDAPSSWDGSRFRWTFFTVPAGETYIRLSYIVLQDDIDTAISQAAALAAGTLAGMFTGISNTEASQVMNWGIVNADTDGDGMHDWFETAYGLSTSVDDADTDTDLDGLSNLEEYERSTDPSKADTDGDGLSDGNEVNTSSTDPLFADTDFDGVSDGAEVTAGKDPLDGWDSVMTRITNDPDFSDTPDIAVDSDGNLHIAFMDDRSGRKEIYYKLLDSDFNTLINTTVISNTSESYNKIRPNINLDSSGRAFVVWHRGNSSDSDVQMSRVEPALAVWNGSSAAPGVITPIINSVFLSADDGDKYLNPQAEFDGSNNLHVVWEDYNNGNIQYVKLDTAGAVVAGVVNVASPCSDFWHAVPDLGLDPEGNVHIAWNDSCGSGYEMFYTMLDGTDGSTLIAPTMLTDSGDAYYASNRQSINVDSGGMVYIVWQNVDDTPDFVYKAELNFMKLDPSLDDQDGGAASASQIMTIGPKKLVEPERFSSGNPFSTMAPNGNIHVTWYELRDYYGMKNRLHHMAIDSNGNVVSDSGELTYTAGKSTGWTNGHLAFKGTSGYLVYTDAREGFPNLEVALYKMTIAAPTPTPDADTGGGGGGGGGGCFIATAAYGSYMSDEVMALRRFRDEHLLTNPAGRALVDAYYSVSPPVADYIAAHPALRAATRIALKPVLYSVQYPLLPVAIILGAAGGLAARRRRKK
jgi:hypothetical protein